MIVNIIGLGYIGLPLAVMLSNSGNHVIGSDINSVLLSNLIKKNYEYFDLELKDMLISYDLANLTYSNGPVDADIHIIAVPTPINKSKTFDESFILSALKEVFKVESTTNIVVIESTIPTNFLESYVYGSLNDSNLKWKFVHCPERILPGNLIYELIYGDRIIGSDSPSIRDLVSNLYKGFTRGRIFLTDFKTAAMVKLTENSFRDINIAFANQIALMCNDINVKTSDVISLANHHPRVNILSPGPGVGGHCIPVDPWFLISTHPKISDYLKSARILNDSMPHYILDRISKILDLEKLRPSDVGFYGLTYKANVKDTRESPSSMIIQLFINKYNSEPSSYDPIINQNNNFNDFIKNNKLIVVLVDHSHIIENKRSLMNNIVYDTKNCLNLKGSYKL
jgi:UDP-N-acetyl-D-mannosaminuronic acid dehydrogenase